MPTTRTPVSTQERQYLHIEGQLLDGLTGQPVSKGNVHLSVRGYDEKGKGWLEQHRYATSDADGRYRVENVPAKMLEKDRLVLTYELTGEGYVGSRHYETEIKKDTRIVKDFGLLPVDGAALFSGTVMDVVAETPLADVRVVVDIQERDASRRWHPIKKLTTQTNERGEYALKVEAPYLDAVEGKYFCRAQPVREGVEIAIRECTCGSECLHEEVSGEMVNFAVQIGDFHLVNLDESATLTGELKDSAGTAIQNKAVKVELGHRSGCGCGCGEGVVDSEMEVRTDATGGFQCAVPLQFLYGSNYWLSVSAEPGDEDVKMSYERVLSPGRAERVVREHLDSGLGLVLDFSVRK